MSGKGHEAFDREEEVVGSSERAFGLVIGGVLAVIALLPLLGLPHGPARWWLLAIAAAFAGLGVLWPASLRPLNKAWLKFGLLLYRVVNPVVLGLLFYGCVTPIGWLMRATGKDPLRLKLDRTAKSYWIPREKPPGPMNNQF